MVTPGKLSRRAVLFDQLANMISAGVPLAKAVEMAARDHHTGLPPIVLHELTRHLQDGRTFSDAMLLVSGQKRLPESPAVKPRREYWLSDFDVALLSAGEESGRLDSIFKLLARYYASRAKLIRDTLSGLFITLVTLHVFLLIFPLSFFLSFVLGIVNGPYSQCWPFIIEKLLVFGLLYGGVWFFAFASQNNRGEGWRSTLENIYRWVPLLRTALQYLTVARFSMALDALLSAGVPVIRSWEMAAAACGSLSLKRQVTRWTPALEARATPAEIVAQIPYFPEIFVHLYQTGEMSGKLDESLARLQAYFEDEGLRKLQAFCRLLAFTLYVIIAFTIAAFIIHSWMKYFGAALNSF